MISEAEILDLSKSQPVAVFDNGEIYFFLYGKKQTTNNFKRLIKKFKGITIIKASEPNFKNK